MGINEWHVIGVCFGLRILVMMIFPSLQGQLDRTVEFSTPVNSFRSLEEGVYLVKHKMPVYDGGVVHHLPLMIALMSVVESVREMIPILYAGIDSLIAFQMMQIAKIYEKDLKMNAKIPGMLYAVNPLVLLSCVSQSTSIFVNLGICTALLSSLKGKNVVSALSISFSGYFSPHTFLLVVPIIGISRLKRVSFMLWTVLFSVVLQVISFKLNNDSWSYLSATYWVILTFSKLRPNLGLWWYFFIEMFEFFIPFFKSVFNLFAVSFIIPFTLRFSRQSMYAFILCVGWITLTKSYPTLGDGGFFLGFVPFFKPLFGYLRYPVVSTLLFIHAIVLSPIFYYLWVGLGSGNSNFFYAISLVYTLAISSVIVDLTWAMIRIEYDLGKPNLALKLTQV